MNIGLRGLLLLLGLAVFAAAFVVEETGFGRNLGTRRVG